MGGSRTSTATPPSPRSTGARARCSATSSPRAGSGSRVAVAEPTRSGATIVASPDYATVDFFRDRELFQDPHAYYEWVRAQGPVWRGPKRGVVFVSGFDEAVAVYRDHERFSSCNTVAGPFFPWPVPLEGDDISAIIEEHRDALPFSDQLPSFDPPKHTDQRGLLMRLITPKRL